MYMASVNLWIHADCACGQRVSLALLSLDVTLTVDFLWEL